jgi:hypothetical protein
MAYVFKVSRYFLDALASSAHDCPSLPPSPQRGKHLLTPCSHLSFALNFWARGYGMAALPTGADADSARFHFRWPKGARRLRQDVSRFNPSQRPTADGLFFSTARINKLCYGLDVNHLEPIEVGSASDARRGRGNGKADSLRRRSRSV